MKKRTRQAILDAARKLFPLRGYDGTSIDSLAAEARVTKITIYRHFESKEALFSAALQSFFDELPAPASVVSGQRGSLRTRLTAIARNLLGLATGCLMVRLHCMLSAARESFPNASEDLWTAHVQPYHQALRQILNREQTTGALEMTDPDIAATHFLSLITGEPMVRLFLTGTAFREEAETDRHVCAAVDIFLRGYGYRHARGCVPGTQVASAAANRGYVSETAAG